MRAWAAVAHALDALISAAAGLVVRGARLVLFVQARRIVSFMGSAVLKLDPGLAVGVVNLLKDVVDLNDDAHTVVTEQLKCKLES